MSLVPFGRTTLPSDFTASAVRAVTVSPGLFFLASTEPFRLALIAVPLASEAPFCHACAEAFVEVFAEAPACVLPAWTEALVSVCALACAPDCVCAAAVSAKAPPSSKIKDERIMGDIPPLAWVKSEAGLCYTIRVAAKRTDRRKAHSNE